MGNAEFLMPLYLINVMHLPLKEIAMFAGCRSRRRTLAALQAASSAKFFGGKDAYDHDQMRVVVAYHRLLDDYRFWSALRLTRMSPLH